MRGNLRQSRSKSLTCLQAKCGSGDQWRSTQACTAGHQAGDTGGKQAVVDAIANVRLATGLSGPSIKGTLRQMISRKDWIGGSSNARSTMACTPASAMTDFVRASIPLAIQRWSAMTFIDVAGGGR